MQDQILLAIAIVLAGLCAAVFIYELGIRLQRRLAMHQHPFFSFGDAVLIALGRPLIVAVITVTLYVALRYFTPLPDTYRWLLDSRYLIAVYVLIGAWIVSNFSLTIIKNYAAWQEARPDREVDMRFLDLLRLSAQYLIWFIALLFILSYLDINITPLLAGAGIAGLAVALAAQDLLSNMLGGAIIMVDRPFALNDKVRIEPYTGTVIRVGIRSTRLRTAEHQIVTIPNAKISGNIVVNYSVPDIMQKIRVRVPIRYGPSIDQTRERLRTIATQAVAQYAGDRTDLPPPEIYLTHFLKDHLIFELIISGPDHAEPSAIRDQIYRKIAEEEQGGLIPYPLDQRDRP
ncbi:mechanosensitive ion channel family protein [Methanosphaerula subterraneus]|uniref:mechanosensitive ion channel family protein n=1 Tax=Methanosphaerula subterraneus TaxID=3350244 RepID=UPI003F8373DF